MTRTPARRGDRVFVTGLGLVGPSVGTPEDFWSLLDGEEEPRPSRLPPSGPLGAYLGFPAGDVDGSLSSRLERLALYVCKQAVAETRLGEPELADAGVILGSTHGTIDRFERSTDGAAMPAAAPLYGAAAAVAEALGCCGPNQVLSTACSASLNAIGLARKAILDGRAEIMLAGGGEIFSRVAFASFERLGGMDSQYCRPFDQSREGAVFGEGVAVLVLESERYYRARGAPVPAYCAVDGFGWSCDAFHATAPEPSGEAILSAMREALADAERAPGEVSCVLPHGTGTRLNDEVEARTLSRLLGSDTPVFPVKAFVGHGAGAAGAFSCVAGALMFSRRTIPAAANCNDPEFDLDIPRLRRKGALLKSILVNGAAFGGNNASVLLGSV